MRFLLSLVVLLLSTVQARAETVDDLLSGLGQVDITLKILFLITVLALVPSILITVTAFTRIVIVLSLLRHALGTPQTPPNQVVIALSLFLTVFTMAPTFKKMDEVALQPYLAGKVSDVEAVKLAVKPLKEFMLRNTRKEDLKLFLDVKGEKPSSPEEVSMVTLIPAFMVSEIKTAFEVVFVVFLPFIVIDLLVASILMSMGMMMLSPMIISLPFKIMLFVLVDGWSLIMETLAASFFV
ncbi:MAG: flagellar type III secretion system pore protein FliP [Desulfurobacteriaceae bacterium]